MAKDTIYSVYKEDTTRRKLENVFSEFYRSLHQKKFDGI